MILKTLTHDHGKSDCWNYYDNVESASIYYDDSICETCIAIKFNNIRETIVVAITDEAYLCNDLGKTIERLRSSVKCKINNDKLPKETRL